MCALNDFTGGVIDNFDRMTIFMLTPQSNFIKIGPKCYVMKGFAYQKVCLKIVKKAHPNQKQMSETTQLSKTL